MTQSNLEGRADPAGDPRVDAAVARLVDLDSLDLPAQLEVFTQLQASLAAVLDSPDPAVGRPDQPDAAAPPAS